MTNTVIPIGMYIGNPNGNSASADAWLQSMYNGFQSEMGVAAQYNDVFIDWTQPVSSWLANSEWTAWSNATSSVTQSMTPVIALPMVSAASGSLSADASFKAFASGAYDQMLNQMVANWAANGYTTQIWRPGWEMNVAGTVNYVGTDPQTQADFIAAFQHIYTVLHAAAAQYGVNLEVVWNPSAIGWSAVNATTQLYPGNNYVDAIGADVYADAYPTLYDFASNGAKTDTTMAQWLASPANQVHYWNYPQGNQWSNNANSTSALSLTDIINFAAANNKPLAIPETGAGNSGNGTDNQDDATFPQWLATTLQAAQASGVTVQFVNIWDANSGGNYEFSLTSDGKPLEQAAWAQYFGAAAQSAAAASSTTTTATVPALTVVGTGADKLTFSVSQTNQTNAQFTISVDGVPVGGTQTIVATTRASQTQAFEVDGNWGAGVHLLTITYLNPTGSGTSASSMYVIGATYDNVADTVNNISLSTSAAASIAVGAMAMPIFATLSTTNGSAAASGLVNTSKPTFSGTAQAGSTITLVDQTTQTILGTATASSTGTWSITSGAALIDGAHTIAASAALDGMTSTATTEAITVDTTSPTISAIKSSIASGTSLIAGKTDTFTLTTSEAVTVAGAPTLTLSNGMTATYNASASTSTSLVFTYTVKGTTDATSDLKATAIALNGGSITDKAGNAVSSLGLTGVSGADTGVTILATPAAVKYGSGSDTLVLNMSEDAYLGNAQFTVSVDGVQVGGTFTATALHSAGQDQTFTLLGNWGSGRHVVSVNFLNDAWGGTSTTDRNLYVDSESYDGISETVPVSLMSSGVQKVAVGVANGGVFTFTDTLGDILSQTAIAAGSKTTYVGTLTGNVFQWVNSGVIWASTSSFAQNVTVGSIVDGSGQSYGLQNLQQSNATLSGATNGTLLISAASGGAINLSNGNYNAQIQALASGNAATNTFNLTLGSGTDNVSLDASQGWGNTTINVTTTSGSHGMSFIWGKAVNYTNNGGTDTLSITGGSNAIHAGTGSVTVTESNGTTAYYYGAGDGNMTINSFVSPDSLYISSALKSVMTTASDGHNGTLLSFGSSSGKIDLVGVSSFNTGVIHWN